MDPKHRVYYFVNLNQNYRLGGWWNREWDNYGHFYNENLKRIKHSIPSLKIRPSYRSTHRDGYFQMKVSCKKDEEKILISTLQKLQYVNYGKIDPKTMEVTEVNAKKCDRCGRYYDKNETRRKGFSGVITGVALVRPSGLNGLRYIEERDLCDDCLCEFERFMDMEVIV